MGSIYRRMVFDGRAADPPDPPSCGDPETSPLERMRELTSILDYSLCDDKDPLRVAVAAWKASRLLQFAITGLACQESPLGEDFEVLEDLAGALRSFCSQAVRLAAAE